MPSLARPEALDMTSLTVARRSPPVLFGYGAAALAVAFATLAAVLVEQQFPAPNLSLVFVLPVVFAATAFGWGPALAAAPT